MSQRIATFVITLATLSSLALAQQSSSVRSARGLLRSGAPELLTFDRDGAMIWYRNESPGAPLRRLASLDCGFRRRFDLAELGEGQVLALGLDLADRARFLLIRAAEPGGQSRLFVEEAWTGPRGVRACFYHPGSEAIVFLDPELRELRALCLEERPALGYGFAEELRLFGAELAPELRDPRTPALLQIVPAEEGFGLRRSSSYADPAHLYVGEGGTWVLRPWITEIPSGEPSGTSTNRFAWVIRQTPGRRDTSTVQVRGAEGAFVIEEFASGEILGSGRSSVSQWVTVALRVGLSPGTRCIARGPAGIDSRPVELPTRLAQPVAEADIHWSGLDVRRQVSRESGSARYLLRCDLRIAPQSARRGQELRVLALASIAPDVAGLRTMESSGAATVLIADLSELRSLSTAELAGGRVLHFLRLPTSPLPSSSVAGFQLILVDRDFAILATSDIVVLPQR
jgi:hypothetical protein